MFKRKQQFDNKSKRGLLYSIISCAGIGYELLKAETIRPLLIIGYVFVLICGGYYIFILQDPNENQSTSE
jgi:hypothetical protein